MMQVRWAHCSADAVQRKHSHTSANRSLKLIYPVGGYVSLHRHGFLPHAPPAAERAEHGSGMEHRKEHCKRAVSITLHGDQRAQHSKSRWPSPGDR